MGSDLKDITLLGTFTAISSLASIIQQIHYATSWAIIKKAQYDKAVENIGTPALTVGGAAQKVDVVLFTIRKCDNLRFCIV